MTKKLCSHHSCKAIVEHDNDGSAPRCDKHQRKYISDDKERQRRYEHHYDDKGRNIYRTTRWRKLRKLKVEMNPLCEHCERLGIATDVQEVDHKTPIKYGGEIWDMDNLQSLCKRCHIRKTNKEDAEHSEQRDSFGYLINAENLKS